MCLQNSGKAQELNKPRLERNQDSCTHGSTTAMRACFRYSVVQSTAIQAPLQTDTARPGRRILHQRSPLRNSGSPVAEDIPSPAHNSTHENREQPRPEPAL